MKRIAKIISIVLATAFTISMVSSCGGLGDILDNDDVEDVEYGQYKAGWTEEGDKLIYKQTLNYGLGSYTQVITFEFKNDVCVKATGEFIWPTALLAQAFYDDLNAEDKANARLSGKKVILDMTDTYKDLTKSDLKAAIDASGGWM